MASEYNILESESNYLHLELICRLLLVLSADNYKANADSAYV
jgi:hypothetical protein